MEINLVQKSYSWQKRDLSLGSFLVQPVIKTRLCCASSIPCKQMGVNRELRNIPLPGFYFLFRKQASWKDFFAQGRRGLRVLVRAELSTGRKRVPYIQYCWCYVYLMYRSLLFSWTTPKLSDKSMFLPPQPALFNHWHMCLKGLNILKKEFDKAVPVSKQKGGCFRPQIHPCILASSSVAFRVLLDPHVSTGAVWGLCLWGRQCAGKLSCELAASTLLCICLLSRHCGSSVCVGRRLLCSSCSSSATTSGAGTLCTVTCCLSCLLHINFVGGALKVIWIYPLWEQKCLFPVRACQEYSGILLHGWRLWVLQ